MADRLFETANAIRIRNGLNPIPDRPPLKRPGLSPGGHSFADAIRQAKEDMDKADAKSVEANARMNDRAAQGVADPFSQTMLAQLAIEKTDRNNADEAEFKAPPVDELTMNLANARRVSPAEAVAAYERNKPYSF